MSTPGVFFPVVVVNVLAVSLDGPETMALLSESTSSAVPSDQYQPFPRWRIPVALGEGLADLFSAGLAMGWHTCRRSTGTVRAKWTRCKALLTPSDAVAMETFSWPKRPFCHCYKLWVCRRSPTTVTSILLVVVPSVHQIWSKSKTTLGQRSLFSKILYGAVLFEEYEWAQAPTTDLVNTLLSSDLVPNRRIVSISPWCCFVLLLNNLLTPNLRIIYPPSRHVWVDLLLCSNQPSFFVRRTIRRAFDGRARFVQSNTCF